jgi:hypothetical protein
VADGTGDGGAEPEYRGDPLGAFVAVHRASLPATRKTKRFNSGEHAWLGGHGAERACDELLRTRDIRVDKNLFA